MSNKVYVVHCIDTEGPLYESMEATFSRLKEIFGINLEPTKDNLLKIQNQELDLGGREALVSDAFAHKRIATLGDWTQVDEVLDIIMDDTFRKRIPDSYGNGWVFNWFCLDHAGFNGKNPRRRDAGYGNVYEHYYSKLRQNGSLNKDLLQFHYHPLPFNGHFNYCGTAYVNSNNIFEVLAHRIIDNEMFPAAYRAGMEAERPDSHWFLEQWIPFDYSNDSYIKSNDDRQPDLRDGRYGDWRHASMRWKPYHPSHDDYQIEGNCHRMLTRCISLDSRVAKLELTDIRDAFRQANEGEDSIIAFANHDFRDMREEVNRAMDLIAQVSSEYPEVEYIYSDAISAFRNEEKLITKEVDFNVSLKIDKAVDACVVRISTESEIFGTQPFFAIKTKEGRYLWDNLDYGEKKGTWSYVFDDKTINWSMVDTIGLASNHYDGNTEIVKISARDRKISKITKFGHNEIDKTTTIY